MSLYQYDKHTNSWEWYTNTTQFSGKFSVNLFFREPLWAIAYLDNLAHISLHRKKIQWANEMTMVAPVAHSSLEIKQCARVQSQHSCLARCRWPVDQNQRKWYSSVLVLQLIRQDDVSRRVLWKLYNSLESVYYLVPMVVQVPSASSSMLISSNCSATSIMSLALLILMTIAALPALLRANRNLRRASLTSWGISTVWL